MAVADRIMFSFCILFPFLLYRGLAFERVGTVKFIDEKSDVYFVLSLCYPVLKISIWGSGKSDVYTDEERTTR